jgi:hypothetical protein
MSTSVNGDGTPNSLSILSIWANRYSYVRDYVSISYDGSGVEEALNAYYEQKLVRAMKRSTSPPPNGAFFYCFFFLGFRKINAREQR